MKALKDLVVPLNAAVLNWKLARLFLTSLLLFQLPLSYACPPKCNNDTSVIVPDMFPETFQAPCLDFKWGRLIGKSGRVLRPAQTKNIPEIYIPNSKKGHLYTLVMSDPDAPSRANPFLREFVHWIVVNIPGGDVEKGTTIAEYISPLPPKDTGLHRYVFVAYKQRCTIDPSNEKYLLANSNTSSNRTGFHVAKYARQHEL
eukprot:Ihof_evm2s443 gene=Ihof_evmTU2s443